MWDQLALLNRVNKNETMVAKLIQLFLEEMPTLITEFTQAQQQQQQQQQLDTVTAGIHKIKGMVANISGQELYQWCCDIEQRIEQNQLAEINSEELETLYQSLATELLQAYPETAENQG